MLDKVVPIRLCPITSSDITKIQNVVNSWGYTNLIVEKNKDGELVLKGEGISNLQRNRILVNSQVCVGVLPVSAWQDRFIQKSDSEYIDLGEP